MRIGASEGRELNVPEFEGYVTTICGLSHVKDNTLYYSILMPPGAPQSANEKVLHPIDDGHEPGSWSDCVWKPKKVSA